MSYLFWTSIGKVCLFFLSLRYRIKIQGLDLLSFKNLNRKGGILFLPNHPALMDPLFLYLFLWPKFRMRPLAIEYIYRTAFLKPWIWLTRAIAIPNFDLSVNEFKIKKGEQALKEVINGLQKKENFLIYPSGKLKSLGKEILGGVSGVYSILQECPDINIVLIRTTGLWGSRFSRAIEGRSPNLQKTLWICIKALCKNFFFFLPRRSVLIELEVNPELPTNSRLGLNQALENWYNRYPDPNRKDSPISEIEPLKLVSYSFWKQDVPEIQQKKKKARGKALELPQNIQEKIYAEIRQILGVEQLEIKPDMHLATDLGMDSLNIAELMGFIAKNFQIKHLRPDQFDTVETALEAAAGIGVSVFDPEQKLFSWPAKQKPSIDPSLPIGSTIPEAFLNICQKMGNSMACADDLIGPISYKKMKRAILVLAVRFQKISSKHIAVLLPASVGAYIVILALQMANKVPVMLNWTLGPRYLNDMMKISSADLVISSWRFLDRLSHVEFGDCLDKIVFLEDIRSSLTIREKLRGLVLSHFSKEAILQFFKIDAVKPENAAVILFTSGTEASPKGVSLSHQNILLNQRAAMQCVPFKKEDIIYGILPPFHSFGFSVAGIFPILAGLKVAFYPDPTDSFALAEGIRRWKVTIFCSAPSFLKGLFQAATPEQLKTVRLFVCGAEKTPDELYEKVENLGTATLLEGYGITECSPIISLNSPNLPHKGVGHILPNLQVCMIHPETLELLPDGKEGEICVFGPSVFEGYLGSPRPAFIEIGGRKWYRTGDLGYFDEEENLILSGRLKRFTKLGAEMISLGAVEETILKGITIQEGSQSQTGPVLAVCVDEQKEGQPRLVLFTTLSVDSQKVNAILQTSGFSRLVKIQDVRHIDSIPLMGTGKIDYRTLQSKIS